MNAMSATFSFVWWTLGAQMAVEFRDSFSEIEIKVERFAVSFETKVGGNYVAVRIRYEIDFYLKYEKLTFVNAFSICNFEILK